MLAAALLAGAVLAGAGSSAIALTGGTAIGIQSAPWAVLVNYGTSDTNYGCTGTIIAPSLIATSATCMYESGAQIPVAGLSVTTGVSNYLTPQSGDAEQTRTISAVHIHPGFDASDNDNAIEPDDVAVLTLSAPLNLGGGTEAVSLPSQGAAFPAGASATLATFGVQSAGGTPNGQLESMTATVAPQGECGQPSTAPLSADNAVILCATSPSASLCDGDGGGGLVVTSGSTPTLIGVANGTSSNCNPGGTGFYAYAGAGEIRTFLQGNDDPPSAPVSSKADPSLLVWQGQLTTGSKLLCTTGGWGGSVSVTYSFLNEATGQVLRSGASGVYVIPSSATGMTIECVTAVTNAGGTTVVSTSGVDVKPGAAGSTGGVAPTSQPPAAGISPAAAAGQYLIQISESKAKPIPIVCATIPDDAASGVVFLGGALVKNKAMVLSLSAVCQPLQVAWHNALSGHAQSTLPFGTVDAIEIMAKEWFVAQGITSAQRALCKGAQYTWKWLRRSDLSPSFLTAARTHLLDRALLPPGYTITAGCLANGS